MVIKMHIPPISEAKVLLIKDIEETLKDLDNQTLAEWWCFLNSHVSGENCHWHQHIQVMDIIEERIGHKAVSREWNKDRMTDEEHEKWFAKRFKD